MARLLGRESVSSDIAALFELIKNGYDADAEQVTVEFENFDGDGKNGRIIVKDDGDGMSLDDLQNKWMVIGTYAKERLLFSARKKRRVIGNKGIGRFSTEKLGSRTTLKTRPRRNNQEIELTINWDEYEKQGVTFDQIQNPIKIYVKENLESGTTIILEKLRSKWTEEKINKLINAIGSLILPKELQQIKTDVFDVDVKAPDFPINISPNIQSTLFDVAPFKIISTIGDNQYTSRTVIYKKGVLVKEERTDFKDLTMKNGEKWFPFGKCKFVLYFYPQNTRYENWESYYQKKSMKVNLIRKVLADTHGVKIYRDGFWVRPYGDLDNDWLNLEHDRVMANYKIGNTQVIGFTQITKDNNPDIIDTTTRERLVENNAFHSMHTFAKDAIDSMNYYRFDQNKKHRERKTKVEHENLLESELKLVNETISESDLPVYEKKELKKSVQNISNVFTDFKEEMEETNDRLELSEKAYRNLASLGISSSTAAHEIGHILPHLTMIPKTILIKLKRHSEARELVEDDLNKAIQKINSVLHFTTFIIEFVRSMVTDNEIKHKKEKFSVNTVLNDMLKELSGVLMNAEIQIEPTKFTPKSISVTMNKTDFQAIILNLFSNSLKAIRKLPKKNDVKKIRITITKDVKKFKIKFSDSGIGISEANREKVFRMFFTTHKQGTGLGLSIVQEILEDYGGKIELKPYSELKNGATFVIDIPLDEMNI